MRIFHGVLLCAAAILGNTISVHAATHRNGTLANPLWALSGGLDALSGPAIVPKANLIFMGDSLTVGRGATSCGANGGTITPSPTGNCFADIVARHYGATEINFGIGGTCLVYTTTPHSACNSPLGSGIKKYISTALPYAGANTNWFFIMYGTNDLDELQQIGDTEVTTNLFKTDLATIVFALESHGTPGNQIVLSQVPWESPIYASPRLIAIFNSVIASVAVQYHTRLSYSYRAMGSCLPLPTSCMHDPQHPNPIGHANLATEIEGASYVQAVAALSAGQWGGGRRFRSSECRGGRRITSSVTPAAHSPRRSWGRAARHRLSEA